MLTIQLWRQTRNKILSWVVEKSLMKKLTSVCSLSDSRLEASKTSNEKVDIISFGKVSLNCHYIERSFVGGIRQPIFFE